MHQVESKAATVERIIMPVTPAGGGTGVEDMEGIICTIAGCLSVRFDDPLTSGFLQIVISSD
jgi:hypothetical protein